MLTCSKLVVLDPEIAAGWTKRKWTGLDAQNALRGLAKLYRGRDDDAYILYHLLTRDGERVFNFDYTANFAGAWGIDQTKPLYTEKEPINILPACIQPNPEEVLEIERHLLDNVPLKFVAYPPNFTYKLPTGDYYWVPSVVQTGRHIGFGDLIHNLVVSTRAVITFDYTAMGAFSVEGYVASLWTPEELTLLRQEYACHVTPSREGWGQETRIQIPRELCTTEAVGRFRDTLVRSGLFPIWTVESVTADSFEKWLALRPKPRAAKTWRSV